MLDAAAMKFLERRGIDPEVADRMSVYSGNVSDFSRNSVLVFPFFEHGKVVNEKSRLLPKERFWQWKDARKVLWNIDAALDPACEDGRMPLIICEGELDALTAIQCGFPLATSVPDGAPPGTPDDLEDHSGSDQQDGKFKFIWNSRDQLDRVKRFILAVDNDAPGQRLQRELIRLLSAGRCSFVEYPLGCKDLNDVLMKHGPEAVAATLNGAKQVPVKGLYKISDYPDEGALEVFSTGWELLDQHCQLFFGEFMVITGIPQHGKTMFTLNLIANVASNWRLRTAIFSPEMKIVPILRDRLLGVRIGGHPSRAQPEDRAWLDDMFTIIGTDPVRRQEDDVFDLPWILQRAKDAILRDGARILLIDPWNEIEHARRQGESMHDYISWAIRELKRFARLFNVIVIVVAHPTKMAKNKDGVLERPSLYDVSDSSHWFNKCDHGIVVYRDFRMHTTEIHVAKSRFDEAGSPGMVRMRLDSASHRFGPLDVEGESYERL